MTITFYLLICSVVYFVVVAGIIAAVIWVVMVMRE